MKYNRVFFKFYIRYDTSEPVSKIMSRLYNITKVNHS